MENIRADSKYLLLSKNHNWGGNHSLLSVRKGREEGFPEDGPSLRGGMGGIYDRRGENHRGNYARGNVQESEGKVGALKSEDGGIKGGLGPLTRNVGGGRRRMEGLGLGGKGLMGRITNKKTRYD